MRNICLGITGLFLFMNATLTVAEPAAENAPEPFMGRDIPPPPPGPYMSTALMEAPGFARERRMPRMRDGDIGSPFFNAEMPWPEREAPRRWMPDDGYSYAPERPPVERQPRRYRERPARPEWQPYPPSDPYQRGPAYGYGGQMPHPSQGPWMPLQAQPGW